MICQVPFCEEHYGCSLRQKGITLAHAATPSRARHLPYRDPDKYRGRWEAGVAGEHRPDGSFMPYLNENYRPIHVKEYAENKRKIDAKVRRLRTEGSD